MAHVLNLLLTLLRILIHRKYAQDNILILDVASLYQFLETFPVLSCVVSLNISIHLSLLHLLLDIALSILLTLVSQLLVQSKTTIRRSISRNLYAREIQVLTIGADTLQQVNKLLHRVILQLALAQLSLLNKELNVSFLLLLNNTLESICSLTGLCRSQCTMIQFAGSNNAIGNLYLRNTNNLLTYLSIENKVELTLLHSLLVRIASLHGVVST